MGRFRSIRSISRRQSRPATSFPAAQGPQLLDTDLHLEGFGPQGSFSIVAKLSKKSKRRILFIFERSENAHLRVTNCPKTDVPGVFRQLQQYQ